jgi:nucleoside-diphosphate-sugar epimerase
MKNIFITGGNGYVGSLLVPKLLKKNYRVSVLDLMIYGEDILDNHPNLNIIKGDIRDKKLLEDNIPGHDCVIHLACISNDPSFELDSNLGKSINLDSFRPLVEISKKSKVKRFIYASSSSVYGIKEVENVTEDLELQPLTDYSKYKAECEKILKPYNDDNFTTVTIRPATVCGYSRRLRLDLSVNILTNHAYNNNVIKVFGGSQKRPNIHIEDMTDLYIKLLEIDKKMISGKIFNAGYENHKIIEIADIVKKEIGNDVQIEITSSDDLRSYHISSEKIFNELGFKAKKTINDAVSDLKNAFDNDLISDSFNNPIYYNVKLMQQISLK